MHNLALDLRVDQRVKVSAIKPRLSIPPINQQHLRFIYAPPTPFYPIFPAQALSWSIFNGFREQTMDLAWVILLFGLAGAMVALAKGCARLKGDPS